MFLLKFWLVLLFLRKFGLVLRAGFTWLFQNFYLQFFSALTQIFCRFSSFNTKSSSKKNFRHFFGSEFTIFILKYVLNYTGWMLPSRGYKFHLLLGENSFSLFSNLFTIFFLNAFFRINKQYKDALLYIIHSYRL